MRSPAWVAGVLIAAAVLLATLGVRSLANRRPPAPVHAAAIPVQGSNIGLGVERRTGDLLLTWDRTAPDIVSAQRGLLQVREPGSRYELDLDAAQLQMGRLVYVPNGPDVTFGLQVTRGDGTTRKEMLRYLAGAPAASAGFSNAAKPSAPEKPVTETTHIPAPSDPPRAASHPRAHRTKDSAVPVKAFQPPDTRNTAKPVALPAPTISTTLAADSLRAHSPLPAPQILPPGAGRGTTDPRPPAPTLQSMPIISTEERALIRNQITIPIEVQIDDTGRVVSAKVTDGGAPGARLALVMASLKAARLWRFRPAQAFGHSLPSTYVIRFLFNPRK